MVMIEKIHAILNMNLIVMGDYTLTTIGAIAAMMIVLVGFGLSKLLRNGLTRYAVRRKELHSQIYTLSRMIHYVILTIAFVWACTFLGISLDKLALVAGALGVGIGFGLQNIVNNFVSGIIILFEKSLKIGDLIELSSGVFGEVVEINIRSTVIRTGDNVDIIVPNSEFINGQVTNWTMAENIRRFRIPFSVAYGTDKELVKVAALEAAENVEHTLVGVARETSVLMTGFGDSSLDFVLVAWVKSESVKRPAQLMSDYLWKLDDAFRKYNIEVPFPQRDLHVRSGFEKL